MRPNEHGIGEKTRQRIESGLRNWNRSNSAARKRFEVAKKRLDQKYQHVTDAITNSERITAEDLALIVY